VGVGVGVGVGEPFATVMLTFCWPMVPVESHAFTIRLYVPAARLTCTLRLLPAGPLATFTLLA
jgi:hypothetical protein